MRYVKVMVFCAAAVKFLDLAPMILQVQFLCGLLLSSMQIWAPVRPSLEGSNTNKLNKCAVHEKF